MPSKRKPDDVILKEGQPNDRELDEFALKIGDSYWEKLGLQLNISQTVLNSIKANADDKPKEMLLRWRNTTTSCRPYEELYHALCSERVGLNNPAKEFCCVKRSPAAKASKIVSKEINKGTKRTRANKAKKEEKTDGTKTTPAKTAKKWKKPAGTKRTQAKTPEEEKKPEEPPEAVKEEKKVKGTPSNYKLQLIAKDIHVKGNSWKQLARCLGIEESQITGLHKDNEELYEKTYQMLLSWRQENGSEATYQVLFEALTNELVNCREVAEKYCCES